jgi:hypothetical protein
MPLNVKKRGVTYSFLAIVKFWPNFVVVLTQYEENTDDIQVHDGVAGIAGGGNGHAGAD